MNEPAARLTMNGIIAELWPSAPYAVCEVRSSATLGFAFETQLGVDAIGTDRHRPFRRRANSLSWVPSGCSVSSSSPRGGEYLVIHIARCDRVGSAEAMSRPIGNLVDPAAVAMAQSLRRQLVSGRRACPEGVVDVMCSIVLGRLADGRRADGWLTDARLSTIDRYLERHMHERVCLADLAAQLELSIGFLVLAFRRGLGVTPHRYLMERRLARARTLLRSRHPIAATAEDCGFADQAHLTRHMRAMLGVTPKHLSARLMG